MVTQQYECSDFAHLQFLCPNKEQRCTEWHHTKRVSFSHKNHYENEIQKSKGLAFFNLTKFPFYSSSHSYPS